MQDSPPTLDSGGEGDGDRGSSPTVREGSDLCTVNWDVYSESLTGAVARPLGRALICARSIGMFTANR